MTIFPVLTEADWAAQLEWLEPHLRDCAAGLLEGIRRTIACESPDTGAPILEDAVVRFHRRVMGTGCSAYTWVEVGNDYIGVFIGPSSSGDPDFKLILERGVWRCEIDGFGERAPPDLALAVEMTAFWQRHPQT